jgi:hypothetical protein
MSPEENLEALGIRRLTPTRLENEGAESGPTDSTKPNGAPRPNQQRSLADEAEIKYKITELTSSVVSNTPQSAARLPQNLVSRSIFSTE